MQPIWEAKLDDKYDCRVERTSKSEGHLSVTDTETKEVLLDKDVGLSYGAMFGPDISDVGYWQDLCVKVVDKVRRDA
jgi:hypothetical protein